MGVKTYANKEVLAPFAAIYGVGFAPLLVLPFLFGAILDHFSITPADAGFIVSLELGAMCFSSILIAPVVDRFSKRLISLLGTFLAVSGNLLLLSTDNFNVSIVYFIVAGAGYGLALAAGNAAVAASNDSSDEVYNRIILLGTILMVLMLNLFPRLIVKWSLPGALVGLIVLHILMLPALYRIPSSRLPKKHNSEEEKNQPTILLRPLSLAILLMTFCYFVRDTMVWVFAEHIGSSRLGMDVENIGLLFSIHGGMSLLGPLLLLWLMRRYGKSVLLIAGIIATGVITVWISQTESVLSYSLLAIIWSTAHFFTYSCIMGFATTADHKGRIAAATGAAVMGGNAVAPAIAGYAMNLGGMNLFSSSVLVAVIATILFAGATVVLSRRQEACLVSAN